MLDSNQLQQLLKNVMAGDAEAQDAFCKHFEVQLRRMLATSFPARGAVGHSDIAQSTFRRFFQELKSERLTISQPQEVMAILIRYARNLQVDVVRKQAVSSAHSEKLQHYHGSRQHEESAESTVEQAELVTLLNNSLKSSLTEEERRIVDLRSNGPKTFREVGLLQNMSTSAAQKIYARAIVKLRAHFQSQRQPVEKD